MLAASKGGQSANLYDSRTLCLCLLSYAGFMRIDELLSIKIGDITFRSTHMEINICKRKNDQFREGHAVVIARSGKISCPVGIAERYISNLRDSAATDSPLIRRLHALKVGWKPHPYLGISYTTARSVMLEAIKPFVGDISCFGTHSFRAGAASEAANRSVNERCIARHGGWKSVASKDMYIKDSLANKLKVSQSIGI